MSLILDRHDPAKPQTHALILGISDYPHLPGGSQFAAKPAKKTFGLASLSSPAVSAEAFAQWITGSLNNRQAPLGSVDLLLSPETYTDPAGGFTFVDVPAMRNIQQAFDDWQNRCDQHPDNAGIFYFCGHGFQRAEMMILPADFGDPAVPVVWDNIIDFTTTHIGMVDCRAKTQVYFIDACRETPLDLLRDMHGRPRPLKTTFTLQHPRRNAPVLQAATTGAKAHGAKDQVSYFTEALLDCLKSFGPRQKNGQRWQVSTDSLAMAMKEYMKRKKVAGLPPLTCDTGAGQSNFDTVIHEFTHQAQVMALIDCLPPDALTTAEFAVADPAGQKQTFVAQGNPWEVNLPAGMYDVEAKFTPPGAFPDVQPFPQLMAPPVTSCTVEAGP